MSAPVHPGFTLARQAKRVHCLLCDEPTYYPLPMPAFGVTVMVCAPCLQGAVEQACDRIAAEGMRALDQEISEATAA